MLSEALRQLARSLVFPVLEHTWAASAGLAGRLLRTQQRVQHWSPEPGGRVVIVAPHPDDETAGVGGTALLHARAGHSVTLVVVTDGGASRAGGLPRTAMVQRREREAAAAARLLEVGELVWLGLPEGRWHPAQAHPRLAPLLQSAQIIYAPSCVDYHPEHVLVAGLVADLLRPGQLVRVYELGVPLTPLLINLVADIQELAALKRQALALYTSQAQALLPLQRLARYRARLFGLQEAEVFWQLPAEAYARVIASGDWRGHACPYRGIRSRPICDPCSALQGLRARAALRRIAAGSTAPRPASKPGPN